MKKLSFLLLLFAALGAKAQVTHGLSFQVGVTQTFFLSQVPQSPSYSSTFLPMFAFDYQKFNDNLFWGGLGIGISPRYMPLYKYEDGTKIGIRYPEAWMRVRTGFKLQGDFLTNLPHIGLGVAMNIDEDLENYTDNGFNNVTTYSTSSDTSTQLFRFRPYVELSNTFINSTFREGKRNMFVTFGVRYYPLNLFQQELPVEYDFNDFRNVQYRILEIFISAGIQRNIQR